MCMGAGSATRRSLRTSVAPVCHATLTSRATYSDSEVAAYIALKAGCIVVDSDYAKAPQLPYPAGYNDVADVAAYILSRPDDWDLSRFTMSGASSGGCLALSVAAHQAKGAVKGIVTLYPAVDLSLHPHGNKLVPAIPKGNPGLPLSLWERQRYSTEHAFH